MSTPLLTSLSGWWLRIRFQARQMGTHSQTTSDSSPLPPSLGTRHPALTQHPQPRAGTDMTTCSIPGTCQCHCARGCDGLTEGPHFTDHCVLVPFAVSPSLPGLSTHMEPRTHCPHLLTDCWTDWVTAPNSLVHKGQPVPPRPTWSQCTGLWDSSSTGSVQSPSC